MDANAARGIASRRRESNAGVQHPAELRQAPADTKTVRAPRTPRPVLAPRQPAPVLQPRPPRTRNIERQVEATERKALEERAEGAAWAESALQVPAGSVPPIHPKFRPAVTRSPNSARKTPEPFTRLSPTWDVLVRLDKKYRKAAELEALDLEEEGLLVKEGREYRITAFVRYVLEREFERLREKHGK